MSMSIPSALGLLTGLQAFSNQRIHVEQPDPVGVQERFHTVCGCRALMVGKQGFAQGKILRVCGELFQGVHGSCHPN